MNVFDFAMKMEKDGKAYYEALAGKTELESLKTIFTTLAEDEQVHYEIFQKLKQGGKLPVMPTSTTLARAKNVFAELPGSKVTLKEVEGTLSAYQHAMKVEAESFRFYEKAAAEEKNQETKKLLLKIAEEEHKHFTIIENIYNFVNAPSQYLPGCEVSSLEEIRQFGRDVDL